jgi:hypothetical protein
MFTNLTALLGAFAKTKLSSVAAFGDYTVQRQVEVSVSDGVNKSKRKFLSRDKFSALGNVGVTMTEEVHDPRGYNTEIIEEVGDIGPELMAAKLRTHGGLPKDSVQYMTADIDAFIWDDSQITLLTALLSTAYVLQAKEEKKSPSSLKYRDGHVAYDLLDEICHQPESDEWWREDRCEISGWDQVMNTEPEHRNILHTIGLSSKSVTILALLMGGKKKTTRYAYDLEIPPLAEEVMFNNVKGAFTVSPGDITSRDVIACLNMYVKVNRLEGAFEAAYAIFGQVAITPVPDVAEGAAWMVRPRHVVLPRFRAHRGLYSIFIRDAPYGLSSSVSSTWKLWRDVKFNIAVQHAMLNAVSLWGRYFAEAGYYHGDAEVDRLGAYDFGTAPSAAYYCYASLVTGHDTYCPVPRNLGLAYAPWPEDEPFDIPVEVIEEGVSGYDIKTGPDGRSLVVSEVPQPCSTVHVMGRMPRDGYFSSLSSEFDVTMSRVDDGFVVDNMSQAWGVGLATRWLGYDTEMEYRGKTRIANWASNDTSMAARPFHVKGPDRRTVTIKAITPRLRTFANLPSMADDVARWHVNYNVDDTYTVTSLTAERISTRGQFLPPKEKDPNVLIVDTQTVMYTPVTLRVASRANVQMTGFSVLPPQTSHRPPEPVRPYLESGIPDEGQEEEPGPAVAE